MGQPNNNKQTEESERICIINPNSGEKNILKRNPSWDYLAKMKNESTEK